MEFGGARWRGRGRAEAKSGTDQGGEHRHEFRLPKSFGLIPLSASSQRQLHRLQITMPSTSVPATLKRKRTEKNLRNKGVKKFRKSKGKFEYYSSSEEEDEDDQDGGINLREIVAPEKKKAGKKEELVEEDADTEASADEEDDAADSDEQDLDAEAADEEGSEDDADEQDEEGTDASDFDDSEDGQPKKRKRNDPDAFATSMSKILGSKLSTSKRQDPVLSRSRDAATASKELSEARLDARVRNKLKADKREALEKGRVKDVLGLDNEETSTAEIVELERRLKKTAQRGVVKLFNAVRAAQVKGEQAAQEAKKTGVIGIEKREQKVTEMSKQGFLDMIAGGGKKPAAPAAA